MTGEERFTCPRCFHAVRFDAAARFCPHCGLPDAARAAADTSPLDIQGARQSYRVLERIAVGAISNLYRCAFKNGGSVVEGLFKVARDPRTNSLLANEAAVLQALHGRDFNQTYGAFLPTIQESLQLPERGGIPRQANVLSFAGPICSLDDLYTLEEVRAAHPAGLDPRDMAWIWRRLLSILSHAHSYDIVHTAVLPMHVLIEPKRHGLILIDWTGAVMNARHRNPSLHIIHDTHAAWYRSAGVLGMPVGDGLDIELAARCMIQLLGGDPIRGTCPTAVEPAITRHLQRCLAASSSLRSDAATLLRDFDRLIETLWGPRSFRAFPMPPKRRS
jgi:hypothetical protein